uniref:Hypothetical chloroplast RF1 n=1 Tax=Nephroselmis pyriformis TaxID=156128 RepID=A0A8A2H8Y0_9CHLO|nr:hypothetical chloroplast RF1 [Nephroselmis pyriformis]QSV37325.1 hypothetical chloroplast RF1 [Nephroselmis pyriformis]
MQIANDFFSFLYTLDNGFAEPTSILIFLGTWLRGVILNLITFQWVGWLIHLPQVRPMLSDEMFRERLVFLPDTGFSSSLAMFSIFDGPETLGLNKFGIGFLNSFFLLLPVTLASAINIRRLVLQGVAPWMMGTLGIIAGEILFIGAVLFGCEFLIARWYFLGPASYFLGLAVGLWAFYKMGAKQRTVLVRREYLEMFLVGFSLSWFDQSTMFEKLQYFSWSAEQTTLLQRFNSVGPGDDLWIHGTYLMGLTVGCLSFTALASYLLVTYGEFDWIIDPFAPVVRERKVLWGFDAIWADDMKKLTYRLHYGYPPKDVASFYFALIMAFVTLPYHSPGYLLASPWQFRPRSDYLRDSAFTDIKNDAKHVFDQFCYDETQFKEGTFFVEELNWRKKIKRFIKREFFLQRKFLPEAASQDLTSFVRFNAQSDVKGTPVQGWYKWGDERSRSSEESQMKSGTGFMQATATMNLNLRPEDQTEESRVLEATKALGDVLDTDAGSKETDKESKDEKAQDNRADSSSGTAKKTIASPETPAQGLLSIQGKKQQKPPKRRERMRLLLRPLDQLEATERGDFSVAESNMRRKRQLYNARAVFHPEIQTREDWFRYKRQLNSDRSMTPDLSETEADINFQQAGEQRALVPPHTPGEWKMAKDPKRLQNLFPKPPMLLVKEVAFRMPNLGPHVMPDRLDHAASGEKLTLLAMEERRLEAGFIKDPALINRHYEERPTRNFFDRMERAISGMMSPRPEVIESIQVKMRQGTPEETLQGEAVAPFWAMAGNPWRQFVNSSMRRRDLRESWRHQNTFYSIFGQIGLKYRSYMNLFPPQMITFRIMADQVLAGQPKRQFVTDEQRARLQYHKAALSRYHRSLRGYRESINASVISQLGFAKSRLNYAYRQQFKGTYRVVRRLFFADSKRWTNPYNEPIFEYGQLLPYDPEISFRHEELPPSEPGDDQRLPLDALNAPLYLAWDDSLRKTILTTGRRERTSLSPNPITVTVPKEVTETWKYPWDPKFLSRSSRIFYDPDLSDTVPVELIHGGSKILSKKEVYEGPARDADPEINRNALQASDPIRSRYKTKG